MVGRKRRALGSASPLKFPGGRRRNTFFTLRARARAQSSMTTSKSALLALTSLAWSLALSASFALSCPPLPLMPSLNLAAGAVSKIFGLFVPGPPLIAIERFLGPVGVVPGRRDAAGFDFGLSGARGTLGPTYVPLAVVNMGSSAAGAHVVQSRTWFVSSGATPGMLDRLAADGRSYTLLLRGPLGGWLVLALDGGSEGAEVLAGVKGTSAARVSLRSAGVSGMSGCCEGRTLPAGIDSRRERPRPPAFAGV